MAIVQNPIRRGMYPDPSICRAGDYYYCVHSSFGYAPGIPIFRSKNLVEWEPIGYVLTRESQLRLGTRPIRRGIFAPTIRFHEGVFYVIVTNIDCGGNFYVTATDPLKEWSDPYFLTDAEGIDPSLFFDGNKCYFVGQRQKKKLIYDGECEIWLRELDLEQHKLTGKTIVMWDGAMKKSIWDEGPHLYKKGDYYYLLVAEGGTSVNHSICVARSRYLTEPFEGCPNNPIFTHRHLGKQYPIQSVGHGDLVETPEGNWYIVMLGERMLNGCAEMGRETFIADVTWQDDWPVINASEGRLRQEQEIIEKSNQTNDTKIRKASTSKKNYNLHDLIDKYMLVGIRHTPDFLLKETVSKKKKDKNGKDEKETVINKNQLVIPFYPATLRDTEQVGFAGIRMEERTFTMKVDVMAELIKKQEVGLVCYYDEDNMVSFCIRNVKDQMEVCVIKLEKGKETVLSKQKLVHHSGAKKSDYALKISGEHQKLSCSFNQKTVFENVDISFLCSQQAGGFTGTFLGMYATGNHGDGKAKEKNPELNKAVFSEIKVSFKG